MWVALGAVPNIARGVTGIEIGSSEHPSLDHRLALHVTCSEETDYQRLRGFIGDSFEGQEIVYTVVGERVDG